MQTSNLHTLMSLFKKTDSDEEPLLKAIEIPIIQRDYAQGRKNKEVNRIRSRFLSSLYDALTQNHTIKLDFVYGDIKDHILIPLDGQQRLTTLYLLHWYIGRHENINEDEMSFLKSFSYRTRYSAREFCTSLVDYIPDFSSESLSEDIKDQSWMPLDWKNDPTISSMLTMLDDIHKKFCETSGLWERLRSGCISFYFLSVEGMGLTDDLYIKMNSRGKPLTEFEHFKAEWEGYLKKLDDEVPGISSRISRKLDTDWTDLLWPYKGSNNIIDDEFVKYYTYLCSLIYYKYYPGEKRPDDILEMTKDLFVLKESKKDNILFVENSIDCFNNIKIKDFFNKYLTQEPHVKDKSSIAEDVDVFEDCCNYYGEMQSAHRRQFPIGRMILLYCFILYLKSDKKIDEESFIRRLRIINNLIKASEFELRDDRMHSLIEQTEEIILDGNIIMVDGRASFNANQLQEEKAKQQWLLSNEEKAETLFLLEDHKLLNGGISVIGLDNIEYTERFYSLFDCDWSLVNRALLTLEDYSITVNWRFQIGSKNIDNTWRAIFRSSNDNKNVKETLCKLLEKNNVFSNEYLQTLIDEYLNSCTKYDWRYYIVKYNSMRPEKYGMYYWYDHKERGKSSYRILMMLTEKSLSGRNYNIFLKTLYDKLDSDSASLGHYAYAGDGDKLIFEKQNVYLKSEDDSLNIYNLTDNEIIHRTIIAQVDGIDIDERISKGLNLVNEILSGKYKQSVLENTSIV